jgi:polyisoprenoid-binding protein YceI
MRFPVILCLMLLMSGCARQGGVLAAIGSALLPANNQQFDLAAIPSGSYSLDPTHAALFWEVSHLGFSNYIGRFNRLTGNLTHNPKAPAEGTATISVEAASIDTNNATLDGLLRGPAGFEADRFSEIRFRSTALTIAGGRNGRLAGDLTMKGITKTVVLDVVFNGGAVNSLTGRYTLGFHATGTVNRADWGLTAWAPAVGEQVTLHVRAEFVRES